MTTRKRHTPEQVVRKLTQADRMLGEGKDVARRLSGAAGVGADLLPVAEPVRRVEGRRRQEAEGARARERENATLKRLLADAELEKAALKEIAWKLVSPARRRAAVHHLITVMGVSERFACRVTGQHRTTQPHQPADQTLTRRQPCGGGSGDYAKAHPRWGFRRAYHDARGEGWTVNSQVGAAAVAPRGARVPQPRAGNGSAPPPPPTPRPLTAPNKVWAVDYQFDSTDGRPVKIVSIVDEHTRECLGGLVERSITGDRLIDELDRLAVGRGYPAVLHCDNGPELACTAMADCAGRGSACRSSHPASRGGPRYIESFNGRLRDECSNIELFWSLAHARVTISDWKTDYNHHRRHS